MLAVIVPGNLRVSGNRNENRASLFSITIIPAWGRMRRSISKLLRAFIETGRLRDWHACFVTARGTT